MTDNGSSWSALLRLNEPGQFGSLPQLAGDGAGNWMAVWQTASIFDYTTTQSEVYGSRSVDDGLSWSAPFRLSTTESAGFSPSVATLGNGRWAAAWHTAPQYSYYPDIPAPDSDIVFAESTDGGLGWTEPVQINPDAARTDNRDYYVRLAADITRSRWAAVWSGGTPGDSVWSWNIRAVRSQAGTGAWTPTQIQNAPDDASWDYQPRITADSSGRMIVTWNREPAYDDPDLGGVYFSASLDGGATWSTPAPAAPALPVPGTLGITPTVATDGAGEWTLAFSARKTAGQDSDVFFSIALFPNNTAAGDWSLCN